MKTAVPVRKANKPAAPPKKLNIDSEAGGEYDPRLYDVAEVAEKLDGLEAIGDEEVARYRQQGYLAVENAFTPEETRNALDGLVDLICGRNPKFKTVSYERGAASRIAELTDEDRQDAVRKIMNFVQYDARLNHLAQHPKLLAVLTRLMGEEVTLFQNQALIKPPGGGREKPWHQDHAYFNLRMDKRIIGVWIALDEATVENGCMHVLPASHDDPIIHFRRRDWQICDRDILGRKATAVPLKPGGLLLFDSLLPHGTPANQSQRRRRALQYHYAATSAVPWKSKERMAVFGSEGKDVEC